jgi:hypothetical protein
MDHGRSTVRACAWCLTTFESSNQSLLLIFAQDLASLDRCPFTHPGDDAGLNLLPERGFILLKIFDQGS